tara:strand:- start:2578 stop:3243 length:666 start_codon:yes stop_codon:yes gene_type:complete
MENVGNKSQRIFAITISVDYADKLRILLDKNPHHFYKWIIVVDPADHITIDLIRQQNLANIEILFYSHFQKDSIFDKDGGLRFAQLYVKQFICNDTQDLVLLIDSDIVLPNNFSDIVEKIDIQEDSIYTAEFRTDYKTKEDYVTCTNKVPFDVSCWGGFWGYFQMYTNKNHLYEGCGVNGDGNFRELFPTNNRKLITSLAVLHLGEGNANWKGRVSESWDS